VFGLQMQIVQIVLCKLGKELKQLIFSGISSFIYVGICLNITDLILFLAAN